MTKTCDAKTDQGIEYLNDFKAGYGEEEAFLEAMEEAAKAYRENNGKLSPLGVVVISAWISAFEGGRAYASEMQTLQKFKTIRKGLNKDDIALGRFKRVAKGYRSDSNCLMRLIGKKWCAIFEADKETNNAIRQALKR